MLSIINQNFNEPSNRCVMSQNGRISLYSIFHNLPWQQFSGQVKISAILFGYVIINGQSGKLSQSGSFVQITELIPYFSEETSKDYEKCLELNPKHILALWRLGRIYDGDQDYEGNGSYWFEMKCANPGKALDRFTRIIEVDPKFSQAYRRLGNIYLHSNKEKALQYFLQYLNLNPQDYVAIAQIGEIYHLLNRKQDAIANFTKCIKYNQKDQRALHGFAKIYEDQGNFKEALQCLKKCNEIDHKNAETHVHFGRVYHKMGNMRGAIHAYRKCKQLKPLHKQAQAYFDMHLKTYLNQQLTKDIKH